jgi:ribosomal protein S18 acetylase RimI-like enzyme
MDGQAVGMVSATAPDEDGAVELISMWVDPVARGRGVGDAAVGAVVQWAQQVHPGSEIVLTVKADNVSAIALYERNGFVDAGPKPGYADLRVMRYRP